MVCQEDKTTYLFHENFINYLENPDVILIVVFEDSCKLYDVRDLLNTSTSWEYFGNV